MTKKIPVLAFALLLGTVVTANHSSLFAMDETDHAAAAPAAHQSLLADLSETSEQLFPSKVHALFEFASSNRGFIGPLQNGIRDLVRARWESLMTDLSALTPAEFTSRFRELYSLNMFIENDKKSIIVAVLDQRWDGLMDNLSRTEVSMFVPQAKNLFELAMRADNGRKGAPLQKAVRDVIAQRWDELMDNLSKIEISMVIPQTQDLSALLQISFGLGGMNRSTPQPQFKDLNKALVDTVFARK